MPPKVWLFNAEEVASARDIHYDSVLVPKAAEVVSRFVLCLGRDDLLVASGEIPEAFVRYARRVRGFPERPSPILTVSHRSEPWFLADAIMGDKALRTRLQELGAAGGWFIEPYIESPRIVRLCRAVGMQTDKTNADLALEGLILELNDKVRFKELSERLGVPMAPGRAARGLEEIESAAREYGAGGRKVIVRKARYGGGMGNLVGTADEIAARLPGWYNQGSVLVERFLDFAATSGTLVTITPSSVRYWGADVQEFEKQAWVGFSFPFVDQKAAARLCRLTLRIANGVHRRGARGELNLDWGLVEDGKGGLEPVALECNMRHNGFGHMLRFAEAYFPGGFEGMRIKYLENVRCGARPFDAVAEALRGAQTGGRSLLIDGPGRKAGAVIVMPPHAGKCAVACFSPEPEGIRRLEDALRKALA